MNEFKESKFYKLLQDFFINNDKETFIQFLAEFYNRTEGIIDKNIIQDEIIKELREMYIKFNEEGVDENIVREKVNYFIENSSKIQDIITKLIVNTNNIKNIKSQLDNNTNKLENLNVINVKDLGVKGDGVTDDTQAIKKVLSNYKSLYFPQGNYLITDSLVFEKHNIKMHKEAKILKSFDGVGVFIVGGAVYTHLEDFTITGHGPGLATSGLVTGGHGIVVIGCRVNFNSVTSSNHRGNGVIFRAEPTTNSGFTGLPTYSCNMNKCIIENLLSTGNDGHGILLDGSMDDMSVWRCTLYTNNNRGNGVIFNANCTARNIDGFIYSENDGLNNTSNSHGIVFDGIRNSRFTCYSEGQNNKNAMEIICKENSSVEVFSMRANRDVNLSNYSTFRGSSGNYIVNKASTNNNLLSDVISNGQIISPNLSSTMFYDTNVLINGNICNSTRVRQNSIQNMRLNRTDNTAILQEPSMTEYFGGSSINTIRKANGDINTQTDVEVGDILYSMPIYGFKNGGYRAGGKIDYVVGVTGAGKLGVNIIFYVANMDNSFTETFKILYNGSIMIPALAGEGNRNLIVDKNGIIKTDTQ